MVPPCCSDRVIPVKLPGVRTRPNPACAGHVQKIIAEKLSDKVQIMMVPNDGKFFFANDVLKAAPAAAASNQ